MTAGLTFCDDDGNEVVLDGDEARALLAITAALDDATVSACVDCRSRVLAAVALVDVLDDASAHPRAGELIALADEAPTSHLYVVDDGARCAHRRWLDPLYAEWEEAVEAGGPHAVR